MITLGWPFCFSNWKMSAPMSSFFRSINFRPKNMMSRHQVRDCPSLSLLHLGNPCELTSLSIFTQTKCTIQKSKTGQCNYSSSNKHRALSVVPVRARTSVCFLFEFFVWRFWRGCFFPKIAKPVSRFLWFLVRWRLTWTLSVVQLQSQFFPEKLLSTW